MNDMNYRSLSISRHQIRYVVILAAFIAASVSACCIAGNNSKSDRVGPKSEFNGIWRDIDHGAINSLFCLLKICGWGGDYKQCLTATEADGLPQTSHDLMLVANRMAQDLEARFVTPVQLNSLPLPVLIHLDGDDPEVGSFGVLLQVDERRVILMDGASAMIVNVNKERFLRSWSGAVFIPHENRSMSMLVAFSGISAGLVISFLFLRR